jgi:hypothetical protein
VSAAHADAVDNKNTDNKRRFRVAVLLISQTDIDMETCNLRNSQHCNRLPRPTAASIDLLSMKLAFFGRHLPNGQQNRTPRRGNLNLSPVD